MTEAKKSRVLCQKWEESERGWGTRPDGYSLHKDDAALKQFVDLYWATMPDSAPDEYSRPDGTPYWCEVDESVYLEAVAGYGIRNYANTYPKGDRDGWMSLPGGGHGKR